MSKIVLPTEQFKNLIANMTKGAAMNRVIPLTELIGLQLKDNILRTYTSSLSFYVIGKIEGEAEGEFDITVSLDLFSKLVSKITSGTITLMFENDRLTLIGNGTYKIELSVDGSGIVKFPKPTLLDMSNPTIVSVNNLIDAYNVNKSSLSKDTQEPYMTCYMIKENSVMSSDTNVISMSLNNTLGEDILMSADMMAMFTCFSDDTINYVRNGTKLMFWSNDLCIIGEEHDGKSDYPDFTRFYEQEYPSHCKINKECLSDILDRLSLFVDPYEFNGAYLSFGKDRLTILSTQSGSKETTSKESVKYISSDVSEEFICYIDIPSLKVQLDSINSEDITFNFGIDSAITISCDTIIKVMSLIADVDYDIDI